MLQQISKFRRLSRSEQWLLLEGLFLLFATAVVLKYTPANWFQRAGEGTAEVKPEALEQARAIARIVQAAAKNGLYRANCLQESLALWWLLERRGIRSSLQIGVRKTGDRLEAHAWVQYGGRPLNENDSVNARFTPFERSIFPSGATWI